MGVVAVVYLTVAHAVAGKRLTRSDALLGLLERRGRPIGVSLRLVLQYRRGRRLRDHRLGTGPRA